MVHITTEATQVAPPRSVTGRVLAILGAFALGPGELRLVDISRRTGLTVSTTYRLAAQLCEWGALDRAPGRRYRLGVRLRELISAPAQDAVLSVVPAGAAGEHPLAATGSDTQAPALDNWSEAPATVR